jgi:hypothetical protein
MLIASLRGVLASGQRCSFSHPTVSVKFEVLTAAAIKSAIFWVVMLCSSVEVHRHFGGTLVNFYQATWHYNPENCSFNPAMRVLEYRLHSSGSGYGPVVGFHEHSSEPSGSVEGRRFLEYMTISFLGALFYGVLSSIPCRVCC